MKRLWIILLSSSLTLGIQAQELKCNVTVNSDQIQGSNKEVYDNLKQNITEFLNTTRWTGLTFQEKEKIDCSMLIVVNAVAGNVYTCELTVQSRRPVYNTAYSSTLVNMKDQNFTFTYEEFGRLEYQRGQFTTNLSMMLAYYAYLIIGFDMDSYSKKGGQPYFQECENIVTVSQSASIEETEMKGWKAFDSNRNRYALTNNLMDEAFGRFREYIYEYHRLGLDQMEKNVTNGRARIAEKISVLRDANKARPATYVINTFLDAKADELVNIFEQGTPEEKQLVYETLMAIDPTRQTLYERITK